MGDEEAQVWGLWGTAEDSMSYLPLSSRVSGIHLEVGRLIGPTEACFEYKAVSIRQKHA